MASERDLMVAKLCVERGYASSQQIEECLREASSDGQTMRPLEAVLRRRGYISEEVYREISSSHRHAAPLETLRKCPTCNTVYSSDLCPKCIVGFAQTPSDPALTPVEAEVSPRPGRPPAGLDPDVEAAAANPKNRFGKYILVREIGAGGMGVVFKAWQSDLRRYVALKFIRGIEATEDLERFVREAQLAATLSHPAIAPIYESGDHEGKHYFAMQFLEGQTLDRLLASKNRPPVRKLVEILAQAAEAVEYAHEHGVIHRDLKPQNLMVDPKGRVYVMDFGLAKSVRTGSSLTGSGFAVGTPSYMAPEQAQADAARTSPRSDVYALGAILYQIGAGRPPFVGTNALQMLVDVVNREPVPPRRFNPRFHPELEIVALKALEKDPDRRYTSAAEFAADLRRWLDGEPVHARPSGALSRMVRRVWKHKVLSAGVLAIVLGLVGAAWALLFRHEVAAEVERARSARAAAVPYYQEAVTAFDEADAIRRNIKTKPGRTRELLHKAEENAREAVRRDPTYADAHFLLGMALERQLLGDHDPVPCFTRVIELEPTNVRAYLERGRALLQALHERFGLDSVSVRTGQSRLVFAFKPTGTGFEKLRDEILSDLHHAQALNPKPSEKALIEGSAALAAWRPGKDTELDAAEAKLHEASNLAPSDPYPLFLLSRARLFRRDVEGAADFIVQAVNLAPHDFALLYHGTSTLAYAGRLELALDYADQGLEIWPEHFRLWVKRGNLLAESGEDQRALNDFEHSIALHPGHPEPYMSLGALHLEKARPADALRAFEEGLKHASKNVDLIEARAAALSALDRNEEAEAEMDRVVSARGDAESYSNRASVRSRRRRFPEAMQDFDRALKLEPENPNVLFSLGCHRSREEKDEEALKLFRRSLELGRDHPDTDFAIGDALFQLGRYEEALPHLQKARKRGREQPDTHLRLGQVLLRLKRYDEAIPFLEAAHRDRDDAPVHRALGEIYFNLRRYAESLAEFQEVIRRGGSLAKDHCGLADALLKLKRYEEAETSFSKGLELQSDNPMAWSGRGAARCEMGRLDEGLKDYQEAVRLKPDEPLFLWGVGLIRRRQKKHREALEWAEKAIAAGGNTPWIFELYGLSLWELDQYAKSEEAFDRAIALDKGNPVLYFHRARSRADAGRKEEALADLETAIKIDPSFAPGIGQRGILRIKEKRYKDGAADLRRAIDLQPSLKDFLQPYLDRAKKEGMLGDF